MFWIKKKTDKGTLPKSDQLLKIEIKSGGSTSDIIKVRRDVLEWRDKQIEDIELYLASEFKSLCDALNDKIDKMTYRDLFRQQTFCKIHLEPIYKAWVEREEKHILDVASKELAVVISHALKYCEHSSPLDYEDNKGPYLDAAVAVVATGAGFAVMPPVTGTILFVGGVGVIFGATPIAWPVVVVSSLLLIVGGYRGATVKRRAMLRFQKSVEKAIKVRVLGEEGNAESMRERLQAYISYTAEELIVEIENANTF